MKFFSTLITPALLIIALTLSGCTAFRTLAYSFKSTDRFVPYKDDSRVFYEPGAEEFASLIVSELPRAIRRVEKGHYAKFDKQIRIYVCESLESFKNITGRKVRALTHRDRIFLSPKIMHSPGTIPLYLGHELSHLMMGQNISGYQYIKIPSWFHEGMAAYVSNGGGAQDVTVDEAKKAILSGNHFLPLENAGIWDILRPKYGSYWKISNHMFYRQSMLFIEYLKNRDENAFKTFLIDIQEGRRFSTSFNKSYGMTTMDIWDKFLQNIRS
jgi:hypothetical protein